MNGRKNSIDIVTVGAASTYSCTFGIYNQKAPWTDIRTLSWAALGSLLTQHEFGQKEGSCIVPRHLFRRAPHQARSAGASNSCSSTAMPVPVSRRSVLRSRSTAGPLLLVRPIRTNPPGRRSSATAGASIRPQPEMTNPPPPPFSCEKHYLPRVAQGAWVLAEDENQVVFEHQPCPKYRIAIPLKQPWLSSAYSDQAQREYSLERRRHGTRGCIAARP